MAQYRKVVFGDGDSRDVLQGDGENDQDFEKRVLGSNDYISSFDKDTTSSNDTDTPNTDTLSTTDADTTNTIVANPEEAESNKQNLAISELYGYENPELDTSAMDISPETQDLTGWDYATALTKEVGIGTATRILGDDVSKFIPNKVAQGVVRIGVPFAGGWYASVERQKELGQPPSIGNNLVMGIGNVLGWMPSLKNINAATKITPGVLGRATAEASVSGAALLGANEASTKIIDENRFPTRKEMGDALLVGAGSGILLGPGAVYGTKYTNVLTNSLDGLFGKLWGKTADDIDRATAAGLIDADDINKLKTFSLDNVSKANAKPPKVVKEQDSLFTKPIKDDKKLGKGFLPERVPYKEPTITTPGSGTKPLSEKIAVDNALKKPLVDPEQPNLEMFDSRVFPDAKKHIGAAELRVNHKNAVNILSTIDESPQSLGNLYLKMKAQTVPSTVAGKTITFKKREGELERIAMGERASKTQARTDAFKEKHPGLAKSADNYITHGFIDRQLAKQPEAVAMLKEYRGVVNEFQRRYISHLDEESFLNLPPEAQLGLLKKSTQNLNPGSVYNVRQFDFIDKVGYEYPIALKPAAIKEVAIKHIKEQRELGNIVGPKAARTYANQTLQGYVDIGNSARGVGVGVNLRNKISGKNAADAFKEKSDIGPAVAKYLGERADGSSLIPGTLNHLASVVAETDLDVAMLQVLKSSGLVTTQKPVASDTENMMVPLQLGGRVDVDGMYVPISVNLAVAETLLSNINLVGNNPIAQGIQDFVMASNAGSKGVKVLLNPGSYPTNALGAISVLVANGVNIANPKNIITYLKAVGYAKDDLFTAPAGGQGSFTQEMINDGKKYGVLVANNPLTGDMRLNEMGPYKEVLNKVFGIPGVAYTSLDNAAKMLLWLNYINKTIPKIAPGLKDPEKIKQIAARMVSNHATNYAAINKGIRFMSQLGFAENFVAHSSDMMRMMYHQIKDSKAMIFQKFGDEYGFDPSHMDPGAMRREGVRRLLSTVAITVGARAALNKVNEERGADEETSKRLTRSVLREYESSPRSLSLSFDKATGKGTVALADYYIPHLMFPAIYDAVSKGSLLTDLVKWMQIYFIGQGRFTGRSLYEAYGNKDQYGNKISQLPEGELEQVKERVYHVVANSFTPGAYRQAKKVYTNKEEKKLSDNLLKIASGNRDRGFEIVKEAYFPVKKDVESLRTAKSSFTNARDFNGATESELKSMYNDATTGHLAAFKNLHEKYHDYLYLGVSEPDVETLMKDAGVSQIDIMGIKDGVYNPIERVKEYSDQEYYNENIAVIEGNKSKQKAIEQMGATELGWKMSKIFVRELKKSTKDSGFFSNMGAANQEKYLRNHPQLFSKYKNKISLNAMMSLNRSGIK